MTRKYVRIQEEVEAIQANDNNLDELREFAGDVRKVNPNNGGMPYYIVPGVNIVLWSGSWLIRRPSGRLEVKSSQLFHREYRSKED